MDGGELTLPEGVPSEVTIERPRQQGHGDYATNVALQLAKKAGTNPRDLATLIAKRLQETEGVADVEVAGPGFLNITVEAGAQGQVAQDIVAAGAAYGSSDLFKGQRINLEFVSANPTGPLHLGGTRWAAVGDALGRIFTASGAEVTREYYFNDHGAQIDRFARSLLATARGRGGAGGRVRRPVHRRHRRRGDRAAAGRAGAAGRGGAGGLPRRRRADDVRRDQARPARLRGRLRRLLPRGRPARLGRGRAGGRAAHRDGQHLREGRRALAAHRAVRRRQGPGRHQVGRPAGVHLRRPRLLPRQEGARVRALLHHARRGPPRVRRPDDGDVRRVRRHALTRTSRS